MGIIPQYIKDDLPLPEYPSSVTNLFDQLAAHAQKTNGTHLLRKAGGPEMDSEQQHRPGIHSRVNHTLYRYYLGRNLTKPGSSVNAV